MSDLTEFLLARIAEDEDEASAADSGRWIPEDKGITFQWDADDWHDEETQARLEADTRANQYHIANWNPARVVAECGAKRRIVEHHARPMVWIGPDHDDFIEGEHRTKSDEYTLRLLALPYAEHPDFRSEWRA